MIGRSVLCFVCARRRGRYVMHYMLSTPLSIALLVSLAACPMASPTELTSLPTPPTVLQADKKTAATATRPMFRMDFIMQDRRCIVPFCSKIVSKKSGGIEMDIFVALCRREEEL